LGDHVKEESCGTYGREEKYVKDFGWNSEMYNLEDLGIDGRLILQMILK
jgi:hypothetical protein